MAYSLSTKSQRYDRYEARIKALGRHLDRLRRHPVATTVTVLVLVLGIVAFLLSMGSFYGEAKCDDFVYGDAPSCHLSAFLSKIQYEYASLEGQWSDQLPTSTGTYRIRAVSRNGFGIRRYSEEMTFTLLPRSLEVQIHDGSFVYGDFTPDTPKGTTQFHGLAQGDTPSVEYLTEEKPDGNYDVSVKNLKICNNSGQDVTACYQIDSTGGLYTLTPRPITVTGKDAEKTYDGQTFLQTEGGLTQGTLAAGDSLQIGFAPTPANAGTHPLVPQCIIRNAKGADVTARYNITGGGTLTVHPRPITIETPSATKQYDSKPLTAPQWSLTEGTVAEGQTLTAQVTGTQTSAGESLNTVDIQITDSNGENVRKNYRLSVKTGVLTVTPITLTFKTDSAKDLYTGQPLKASGWKLVSGKPLKGHTLTCRTSGMQIDAGTSDNTLSVIIQDQELKNVVEEGYKIEVDCGTLTVNPRPITITSQSAEKPYDGTPLICHVYNVDADAFHFGAYDQQVRQTNFTGVQIEIGSSANTFTVEIGDPDGNLTTANYDITYVYGTLTVTESVGDSHGGSGGAGIPPVGLDIGIDFPDTSQNVLYATVESIYGSGKMYFRSASYGDYCGDGWGAPNLYQIGGISPLEFIAYGLRETAALRVHLVNDCPTLLSYFQMTTDFSNNTKSDSYYYNEFLSYSLYLSHGYTYDDLKDMKIDPALQPIEEEYRKYVYEEYLQIPDSTKEALLQWAAQNGIRAGSTTLVEDIQTAVMLGGRYNSKGKPYPVGADVAVYFLTQSKEGVCQHFATAATMVYRAFGIPARYTVGFVGSVQEGSTTYLTSSDAHAWVEIYVDGLGWVPMEVTGSGIGMDPDTKINLHVGAYSATKVYDGKSFNTFDLAQHSILSGQLMEGHRLEVTFAKNSNPTTPGTYQNIISRCVVYDENGKDVTAKYYSIYPIPGTLTILPRQITVTMGSATKVYDGTELTCTDYWISQGSLAPEHRLQIITASSIQDVGTASNEPEKLLIQYQNSAGKWVDVTDCYAIFVIAGKLEITDP